MLLCVASPIALKPSSQDHTPWQSDVSVNRGVFCYVVWIRTKTPGLQLRFPCANTPYTIGCFDSSSLKLITSWGLLSGQDLNLLGVIDYYLRRSLGAFTNSATWLFEDEKSFVLYRPYTLSMLLVLIIQNSHVFLSQGNNTIFYNQYVKEKLYLLYAQSYIKLQEKKKFFYFFSKLNPNPTLNEWTIFTEDRLW